MPEITDNRAQARPHLPAIAFPDDRVMYRVSGAGTDAFLQGQLSQSLEEVTDTRSARAAASTPKGRAYLLTRLVRAQGDILLTVPTAIADTVAKQLNKYLMLFRGTGMARLDQAVVAGLMGEDAARALIPAGSAVPEGIDETIAVENGYLVRTSSTAEGLARFELWLPEGMPDSLRSAASGLQEASPQDWLATEISAGIAELAPETLEGWVPQMLNWQHLNGIHFRKGCYTGQEVIARMHYLGQLKKSLFRLSARGQQAPAPGTSIVGNDKSVGEVVRSVALDDGTLQLLAVLRHNAADGPLFLAGQDGPGLALEPLPYPVPERESPAENEPAQPDT